MLLRTMLAPTRYARFEDPFLSIRALQHAFGDTTPSACGHKTVLSVRLDAKEDEKNYIVTAELPGLSESEVEATFEDGTLTIRGEKKVERDEKKDTWHITERMHGNFSRQLSLPSPVQADKIEAKFDKGVLTVTLPKEIEAQKAARKIAIKTS